MVLTGEQLANSLTSYGHKTVTWVNGLPVKTLNKIVCAVFALWIMTGLLQLVWLFIPQNDDSQLEMNPSSGIITSQQSEPGDTVNIPELQALNLFGVMGEVPVNEPQVQIPIEAEINAQKTRLNLTLEGVVHTPDQEHSIAIIVYQGKQEQYHIGDSIPGGNRVTLSRVLLDHIILDNNGSYESLWLYDEDKKAQTGSASRSVSRPQVQSQSRNVTDLRDNTNATDLARDYKARLYNNPGSLADVLRIVPAQKDGQMVGYRVSPGKDRQQFSELGFKSNDIVTSVNNISLSEPSNALEIYKLMRNATDANFVVERDGEQIQIVVSLD